MKTRTPALLLLLSLVACERGSSPERAARASASAAPAANDDEKLALQALPGASGVDGVIGELQKKARATPDKLEVWVVLGEQWVRKAREASDPGFFLNAEACARIALRIAPGSALALDLRGLALLNGHKFREARALAQQVLADRADDAMALGTLSDACLELGEFAEAADAAQKMVAEKPNLPSYSRAAYLRWLQGDAATAKSIMKLAVDSGAQGARDPEPRSWALVQAAMLFWHEGDYDGADAGFDLALQGLADYPPALVGKGRVALAKGDAKRAAELFERAYRQSPLPETAWLLGDARGAAGDARAADAYAEVVKRGRASDPRTLALFFATKDRDHDEALRLASEEKSARGDIYTEDAYAFAAYRAGKIAEAKKASDAALALGTRDARILYHGGAIRIAAGDAEGGKKLLREALRLNPKFDATGAADAARLLE